MTQRSEEFRYAAFISYRHQGPDRDAAMSIQRRLERYQLPRSLARELGVAPAVGACFRDEDELPASSNLSEAIDGALRESRALIVVCSPQTPESEWVNAEVERFRELGRKDRILACLIEGAPNTSYPRSLLELRGDDPKEGIAGPHSHVPGAADLRPSWGESRTRALKHATLRLVAGIYGCRLDALIRRVEKQQRERRIGLGIAAVLLLMLIGAIIASASREIGRAESRVSVERDTGVARKLASAALKAIDQEQHGKAAWLAHRSWVYAEKGNGKALGDADRALRAVLAVPAYGSRLLSPKKGACVQLAFSPDGRYVATGGPETSIWSYRGGGFVLIADTTSPAAKPVRLPHCENAPLWIGFGPAGKWLGVTDYQGTVRVWDREDLSAVPRVFECAYKFSRPGFSPDGRRIAFTERTGRVCLHDLSRPDSEPEHLAGAMSESPRASPASDIPEEELHSPWTVVYGQAGRIAGVARSGVVYLWDANSPQRPPKEFRDPGAPDAVFEAVTFSEDGNEVIAVDTEGGTVHTWHIERPGRPEAVSRFANRDDTGKIGFCTLSPGGAKLAVPDVTISGTNLWDLSSHPPTCQVLRSAGHLPVWAEFHGNSGILATAGEDGVVLWSTGGRRSGVKRREFKLGDLSLEADTKGLDGEQLGFMQKLGYAPALISLAYDSQRKRLIAALPTMMAPFEGNSPLRVLSVPDLEILEEFPRLPGPQDEEDKMDLTMFEGAQSIALDPGGRMLAMGGTMGSVHWWDWRSSGELGTRLTRVGKAVSRLRFCGSEGPLAVGTEGGRILLIDVFDEATGMTELSHDGLVRDLDFHPANGLLAAAGDSGRIRIWKLGEKEPLREWPAHSGRINRVRFSPDGSSIASAGHDGIVHLWSLEGEQQGTVATDGACVRALAFGRGGTILAVGAGGEVDPLRTTDLMGGNPEKVIANRMTTASQVTGTIRIHDLRPERSGNPPIVLESDTGGFLDLMFLDDEDTLAAGTLHGACFLWQTNTETLANRVGQLPMRSLTGEEWRSIVGGDVPFENAD